MPTFSKTSKKRLKTCHEDLQLLFDIVVESFDCTIICGHRTEAAQNAAYVHLKTKLKYPKSKHNSMPSMAVDVLKYPIDFDDNMGNCYFAGYVKGIAHFLYEIGKMKHRLRWGGDFNMNNEVKDSTFFDLGHFELVE